MTHEPTYRASLIGCGRMGATIDDEIRDRPNIQLPFSHAAGYDAMDRVELVATADIDDEQLDDTCARYDISRRYVDYREMITGEDLDGDGTTNAPVEVAASGQEVCRGWLVSQLHNGAQTELPLDEED